LLPLILMPAMLLLPALVFRGHGPESDTDKDDDSGGGGGGPQRPPSPRNVPHGGLPLPDARQARVRIRGHDRPALMQPRQRRPAREPRRRPSRVSHGRA
jgi:hypothetical protein